jgi:hypothetical protein
MPDRTLGLGLPQIELADLARPIDGALKRAGRRQKQRPDLAQIIIDDRLAALEPQRRDQLADPLTRHPRIAAQQPVDLVLERLELRRPRRPTIDRRSLRAQRPPHRVAIDPIPPRELLDPHTAQ